MRWLILFSIIGLSGCARDLTGFGVEGGYICNLKNGYIELQRLSFDVPNSFLNKPCSEFADYSSHKPGDWFSVGGNLQRRGAKTVYVDMFSVGLKVIGGLSKRDLEYQLAPGDFVDFKWDQSADNNGPTLRRVTWTERVGKRCARFDYVTSSSMVQKRVVEYWCWDEVSAVEIPFGVVAYEIVAPGEPWQVDLEQKIFEPVFSSLRINSVTEEYRRTIRDQKSARCGRHIKSYTERGVGWLTGATVEPKWTPVFLKLCGYGSASQADELNAPPPPHSSSPAEGVW